jgi:outer membrane protein TolC
MDRLRPFMGLLCVVVISFALTAAPPYADAASSGSKGRSAKNGVPRLSLVQAVNISLARSLRMADSRLAVQEKEHQRREAFSDFFPTVDLQYVGDWDRYKQSSNISAFAGSHDSRWSARMGTGPGFQNGMSTNSYPYRIDPYRTFSFTATITQPLYTGGKLLNEYKYARLGVDYSAIQFQVDRQDLTLEVYEAYY